MSTQRRILCLDMDAFFASIEQITNPSLKGLPIAIYGKSIIVSSSYEARKFGVKTGQNITQAMKCCPNIQFFPSRSNEYLSYSLKIRNFLESITPSVDMYSIDEGFLDISDLKISSSDISKKIRSWLINSLGITGSIGVGTSRIVAKMATKPNKPNGFLEVLPGRELDFIDSFQLDQICGIGSKTREKLNELGIFSTKDVRLFGEETMYNLLGIRGQYVFKLCSGQDSSYFSRVDQERKSLSRSTTTTKPIHKRDDVLSYLLQLSEAVSYKARRIGYSGKVVAISFRDTSWKTTSFRTSLNFFTSATHHIYHASKSLFLTNIQSNFSIRVISVSLDSLKRGTVLANLDDMLSNSDHKYENLYKALDTIKSKYKNGIFWGSGMHCDYKDTNSYAPFVGLKKID